MERVILCRALRRVEARVLIRSAIVTRGSLVVGLAVLLITPDPSSSAIIRSAEYGLWETSS